MGGDCDGKLELEYDFVYGGGGGADGLVGKEEGGEV